MGLEKRSNYAHAAKKDVRFFMFSFFDFGVSVLWNLRFGLFFFLFVLYM